MSEEKNYNAHETFVTSGTKGIWLRVVENE